MDVLGLLGSKMDVVGLDLSLTSTGISIDEKTRAIISKESGHKRIGEILENIWNEVQQLKYPYVVLEGYAYAKRSSYAFALGELGGVVKQELWKESIPYTLVPPASRAKFATGRGNASKAEVVAAIAARTGLLFTGPGAEDMYDAWVLAEMGRYYFEKSIVQWPNDRLAIIAKLEWK